ncbi:MAG: hypothetical protein V7K98_21745 [Nostoc sp.]
MSELQEPLPASEEGYDVPCMIKKRYISPCPMPHAPCPIPNFY